MHNHLQLLGGLTARVMHCGHVHWAGACEQKPQNSRNATLHKAESRPDKSDAQECRPRCTTLQAHSNKIKVAQTTIKGNQAESWPELTLCRQMSLKTRAPALTVMFAACVRLLLARNSRLCWPSAKATLATQLGSSRTTDQS